jgi:hypothetical protein
MEWTSGIRPLVLFFYSIVNHSITTDGDDNYQCIRRLLPASPECPVDTGEPVCLRDRYDLCWAGWFDTLLPVLQGKVGSTVAGRKP